MSSKIKLYGKLFEQLLLPTKKEQQERTPTILTEHDIPPLANIINFLNHKDKDIFYLIWVANKTQTDLVHLMNRSQPSLSYDIKRIKKRIKFICFLHASFPLFAEWLEKDAHDLLTQEQIMVLTLMFFTSSYSQSARVSKMKPTKVRYIFNKTRAILKTEKPDIFNIFTEVKINLNLVRRTYLRKRYYWSNQLKYA